MPPDDEEELQRILANNKRQADAYKESARRREEEGRAFNSALEGWVREANEREAAAPGAGQRGWRIGPARGQAGAIVNPDPAPGGRQLREFLPPGYYLDRGLPVPPEAWDAHERMPPAQGAVLEGGRRAISDSGMGGPQVADPYGLSDADIVELGERRERRRREEEELKAAQSLAAKRTPEQAAEDARLARQYGVDPAQVEADRNGYRTRSTQDMLTGMTTTAPQVRSWLLKDRNLEIARDDLGSLSEMERKARSIAGMKLRMQGPWSWIKGQIEGGDWSLERAGSALSAAPERLASGVLGLEDAILRLPEAYNEAGARFYDLIGADQWAADMRARGQAATGALRDTTSIRGTTLNETAQAWRESADAKTPEGKTWLESGVYDGLASSGSSVVAVVLAAAGAPNAGLAIMGGASGGDAYLEADAKGLGVLEALRYGVTQGAIETATEKLPLDMLVGDITNRTPFGQMLYRQLLVENGTEQAATLLQDMSTWVNLNPEGTFGDYLAARPEAAFRTMVATSLITSAQTGLAAGVGQVTRLADRRAEEVQAGRIAEYYTSALDTTIDSKLAKRDPEAFREAVEAGLAGQAEQTENEADEGFDPAVTYIDPEAFAALSQPGADGSMGVPLEDLAKAFRIDPEAARAAIAGGEFVPVRTADFFASVHTMKQDIGVAGASVHSRLLRDIRMHGQLLTPAQMEARRKRIETEDEHQRRMAETDAGIADAETRVLDRAIRDADALGVFGAEGARLAGTVRAALLNTMAEAIGDDPEALATEEWAKQEARLAPAAEEDGEASLDQGGDGGGFGTATPMKPPNLRAEARRLIEAGETDQARLKDALRSYAQESGLRVPTDDVIRAALSVVRRQAGVGYEQPAPIVEKPKLELPPFETDPHGLGFQTHFKTHQGGRYEARDLILMYADGMADAEIMAEMAMWDDSGSPDLEQNTLKVRMSGIRKALKAARDEPARYAEISETLAIARETMDAFIDNLHKQRAPSIKGELRRLIGEDGINDTGRIRTLIGQYADRNGIAVPSNDSLDSALAQVRRELSVEAMQPQVTTPEQRADVVRRRMAGELAVDIARSTGIPYENVAATIRTARARGMEFPDVSGKVAQRHRDNAKARRARLNQEANAQFIRRVRNGRVERLIRLHAKGNISSLLHEYAHEWFDILWEMRSAGDPHPWVERMIGDILEWNGMPRDWDAMFDADGRYSADGEALHERLARSFEQYLMEGKAPSVGLRSVFAQLSRWMLQVYRALRGRPLIEIDDTIRNIFDRALAAQDATAAATANAERLAEDMIDALKLSPKQADAMRARYARAREQAESELRAHLIERYLATEKAMLRDEERRIRDQVTAEVEGAAAMRAYRWLSGQGWWGRMPERTAASEISLASRSGYGGNDIGEAKEWNAAVAKGLDMSKEAREARARADGFDTEVRYFHGTNQPITSFDEGMGGRNTGSLSSSLGVWLSDSPVVADDYAAYAGRRMFADTKAYEAAVERARKEAERLERTAQRTGNWDAYEKAMLKWEELETSAVQADDITGQNVLPLFIRLKKPKIIDFNGERPTEPSFAQIVSDAKAAGHDGVIFRNLLDTPTGVGDVATHAVVFDPRNIRSVNAAFDPDNAGSANLLAQDQQFDLLDSVRTFGPDTGPDQLGRALRRMALKHKAVRVFRHVDGRTTAFNGWDFTHEDARRTLGLGRERLEHGIYGLGRGPDGIEWTEKSGEEDAGEDGAALSQFASATRLQNGVGAPTLADIQQAIRMEIDGKTEDEIWEATGLVRTETDGDWAFAVPGQLKLKTTVPAAPKLQFLKDMIEWPELFALLPQLQQVAVKVSTGNLSGSYTHQGVALTNGTIVPLIVAQGSTRAQVEQALRHEIQHAIQRASGWRFMGASPQWDDLTAHPEYDAMMAAEVARQRAAIEREVELQTPRIEAAMAAGEADYRLALQEGDLAGARQIKAALEALRQTMDPANRERLAREAADKAVRTELYFREEGEAMSRVAETWITTDLARRATKSPYSPSYMDRPRSKLWSASDLVDIVFARSGAAASGGGNGGSGGAGGVQGGTPGAALMVGDRGTGGGSEQFDAGAMADLGYPDEGARGGPHLFELFAPIEPGGGHGQSGPASNDPSRRSLDQDGDGTVASLDQGRELDEMGFYSAALESAKLVPDHVWKMGWSSALSALRKGQQGVAPKQAELTYLNIDRMFDGTPLRGEDLKSAVIEHIRANRLLLVERFNRYDPANPPLAVRMTKREFVTSMRDVMLSDDPLEMQPEEAAGYLAAAGIEGFKFRHSEGRDEIVVESTAKADVRVAARETAEHGWIVYSGWAAPTDQLKPLAQTLDERQAKRLVMAEFLRLNEEQLVRNLRSDQINDDMAYEPLPSLAGVASRIRIDADDFNEQDGRRTQRLIPRNSDVGVLVDDLWVAESEAGGWAVYPSAKWTGRGVSGAAEYPIIDRTRLLASGFKSIDLAANAARNLMRDQWRQRKEAERREEQMLNHDESKAPETAGIRRPQGDIRLPGDEPVFEWRAKMPDGAPGRRFKSHWSRAPSHDDGVLVSVRGEERVDDTGGRTLFAGEVQSDMNIFMRNFRMKGEGWTDEAQFSGQDLENMQGVPLAGDTSATTAVAVRAMIYRAARDGFDSVSFPTAETSEIIQGNNYAAQHYETNVKGALEKIARQLGGEVRIGAVEYKSDGETPRATQRTLDGATQAVRDAEDGLLVAEMELRDRELAAEDRPDEDWTEEVDGAKQRMREAQRLLSEAQTALRRAQREWDAVPEAGAPVRASAYVLTITPEMREKVITQGFALFQRRTSDDPIWGPVSPPPEMSPMRLDLAAVEEEYGPDAVAALPPAVRAYSTEATDAAQLADIAVDVSATLARKMRAKSLVRFLSTRRRVGSGDHATHWSGIRDEGEELDRLLGGQRKNAPGLIAKPDNDGKRVRSYTMEQAAQAAWEEGYFEDADPPTRQELLDAIARELAGQPVWSRADAEEVAARQAAEQWAEWFDREEIDISKSRDELVALLEVKLSGSAESAVGPARAAELLGFPTGHELLEALKVGPERNRLIREETRRRLEWEFGDPMRNGTLMTEAEAFAENEIKGRTHEIELDAILRAAGKAAAGRFAREEAKLRLADKQVREVLNYSQWLRLSQRYAELAVEYAGKPKSAAKAAEYKRLQILNHWMYVEAKALAEKLEKGRDRLRSYDKKDKRLRLHEAGADYAKHMRGLLDDYSLRKESRPAATMREARAAWIEQQIASLDPWVQPTEAGRTLTPEDLVRAQEAIERHRVLLDLKTATPSGKSWLALTTGEFDAVLAEADAIWRMATQRDRLIKAGERVRLSYAAGDIAETVLAAKPRSAEAEAEEAAGAETDTAGAKLKRRTRQYFLMHRTLQSLARQFDGQATGTFWGYIVRPLNEAFARLSTLRKTMGADVEQLFAVYSKVELRKFYKDKRRFAGIGRNLTTQGRLAVALNWGNETNRRRLLDSTGWTEEGVQEVLDTLTERDWRFVQSVWDYFDTWFPEADRVHQAVQGAPMTKVEPVPIATRFGVFKGGYYPIKFDPALSSLTAQRQMEQDAKAVGGRLGTRQQPGFGKKRVKGRVTAPLRLSVIDVVTQHLDEVATSIATDEAFYDVGRLVKHADVEAAVVARHGREAYAQVITILTTARHGLEAPRDVFSRLVMHTRNGATLVGLGLNLKTVMLQPLGLTNSVVRVGGGWVLRGAAEATNLPRAAAWVQDKSEFMANRRESMAPELERLRAAIRPGLTPPWLTRASFWAMVNVQFATVDLPTWIGQYRKSLAAGASEADAIAEADQAVIDAQGSGEVHQIAGLQSGGPLTRLFTNFMSYMVTTYNLASNTARERRNVVALTMDMLVMLAVPVGGMMLLTALMDSEGGDDDDDPLWENYLREQVAFLMSPFAGVSQVAGAARGDDAFPYRGPAGLGFWNEVSRAGKAAFEGDFDDSFWRSTNKAAGMLLHYPASALDKFVRGAVALAEGETADPRVLVTGPPAQ